LAGKLLGWKTENKTADGLSGGRQPLLINPGKATDFPNIFLAPKRIRE